MFNFTIAHAFSVGAPSVPSLVHFSFLYVYFQNDIIYPDVLNCPWYTCDSKTPISSHNLPPNLRSALSPTGHQHGHIHMDSTHFPHQVCSWIPILVIFITLYIGTPARNMYGLRFLLISYKSAHHIIPLQKSFLNMVLALPSASTLIHRSMGFGVSLFWVWIPALLLFGFMIRELFNLSEPQFPHM